MARWPSGWLSEQPVSSILIITKDSFFYQAFPPSSTHPQLNFFLCQSHRNVERNVQTGLDAQTLGVQFDVHLLGHSGIRDGREDQRLANYWNSAGCQRHITRLVRLFCQQINSGQRRRQRQHHQKQKHNNNKERKVVTHFCQPVRGGQLSLEQFQRYQGHGTPGLGSRSLHSLRRGVHMAGYPNHPEDTVKSLLGPI